MGNDNIENEHMTVWIQCRYYEFIWN